MFDPKAKSERCNRKIWQGSPEDVPLNQSRKNEEGCNREEPVRDPHMSYPVDVALPVKSA